MPSESARTRAAGRRSPGSTVPSAMAPRTDAAIWSPSGTDEAGSSVNSMWSAAFSGAVGPAAFDEGGEEGGPGGRVVHGDRELPPVRAPDDDRLAGAHDEPR